MTEQEYELTPFVTPSLTDAIERTLLELQQQGVNLDELKDQPKIPINKKRNPTALTELADLKAKGAPVPGQALTNSPDQPYAWEQPAEFASPREALMSVTDSILDEEVLPSLLDTIHDGTGLTDIASVLLYNGFTQGKWNPDTMMLLMEPTLYLLMFVADQANIEYIIDTEGAEEENYISQKDIDRVAKEEGDTVFEMLKNSVLDKGIDEASVPKEILERVASEVPSILERQQQPTDDESLLMRNTNA